MGFFSSKQTIGILGGGQLGKMLLNTTYQWDLQTKVMDPSAEAPARIACNHFVQGDLMDYQRLRQRSLRTLLTQIWLLLTLLHLLL